MWVSLKPPFQQLETADVSAPSKEGRGLSEPGRAIVSLENGSPQGDFITAPSKPLKLEGGHMPESRTNYPAQPWEGSSRSSDTKAI